MCVIYFAFDSHPDHPLILLANRDESYDRPSQPAGYWEDEPAIYAGRDLVARGTWLGVTRDGRFAAVTNYRDPGAPPGARSRGELVSNFLRSADSAEQYLEDLRLVADSYSGFNLLVGQVSASCRRILYFSNRDGRVQSLSPGIYGLSNHLLDTPWPKVVVGKERFRQLLGGEIRSDDLFKILADESLAADEELPSTGVSCEFEKAISAIFIKTPGYGTRCSTLLTFGRDLSWDLEERVFV